MLLPGMDTDVRKEFKKILTKQGMNFRMGQKVTRADVGSNSVTDVRGASCRWGR